MKVGEDAAVEQQVAETPGLGGSITHRLHNTTVDIKNVFAMRTIIMPESRSKFWWDWIIICCVFYNAFDIP